MLSRFRHVQLCATLWTVACQDSLSLGFFRQKYWSGLPCPSPGYLSNPGMEPEPLTSLALAGGFFVLFCFVLPPVPPGKLYGPTRRKNTLIFSPTARSLPVTPTGNWWWRMGVSLPGSEQRMNQKYKERGTRSYTFPCNNQLPVYLLRHSVVSRFL